MVLPFWILWLYEGMDMPWKSSIFQWSLTSKCVISFVAIRDNFVVNYNITYHRIRTWASGIGLSSERHWLLLRVELIMFVLWSHWEDGRIEGLQNYRKEKRRNGTATKWQYCTPCMWYLFGMFISPLTNGVLLGSF